MVFAIDYDGTIVTQEDRAYDDLTTPPRFMPGAKEGLLALKNAGHQVIVFSGRANRALLYTPWHDPMVRAGLKRPNEDVRNRDLNWARWRQMVEFVERELPWAIVDDGVAGKPSADVYLDDKAVRLGPGPGGYSWFQITSMWGEPRREQ